MIHLSAPQLRCLSCKYDLSHLTEHRCPECGRAFDANDSSSYDTGEVKRKPKLTEALLLCAITAVCFVLAAISSRRLTVHIVWDAFSTSLIAMPFVVLTYLGIRTIRYRSRI